MAPALIGSDYSGSPFAYQLSDESVEKSRQLPEHYKFLSDKYNCKFLDGSSFLEVSELDCEHLTLNGHKTLAIRLAQLIK